MNAYAFHFLFELRTGIRNRTLLLMNYLFPLGVFLLLGGIMPAINPLFRDVLLPSMVAFAILGVTLLGLPDPLVNAREAGIFRSYKINGVPAWSLLLIPAQTTLLHLTITTTIITLISTLLFAAPAPQYWSNFLLVYISLAVACLGLGVLFGVIAPNTRMTVFYSQVIFLPSMLIGGVMLPYDMLPETVRAVARLLPSTHGMNAFAGLAMGQPAAFSPWLSVGVLWATGLLAFLLARFLFSWDSRNVARRASPLWGLLALLPAALTAILL
jgi:ABC-2 type transport system permease protein